MPIRLPTRDRLLLTLTEHPYTPDMEMLDAPPLDSSRRSGNIFMSLMRSGSLPDSESLDRQVSADSAATLDSASNSEPYLSSHPNGLRISTRAAIPQRQHSGKMASSVADPPSRHLQHRSSLNQPSSPQVINLDDDSPLPLRQRGQAISAANNRLQVNASDRQDGGCLVDLTGESPPVAWLPTRRPTNRVNLEGIGSHLLRSTSSHLGSRQHSLQNSWQNQPAPASRPRHPSCSFPSSTSLYDSGTSHDLHAGFPSSSADPSAASRMHAVYSHEAGDFLDLSRWHSGPFGSERRDPEGSNRSGVNASSHRSSSHYHRCKADPLQCLCKSASLSVLQRSLLSGPESYTASPVHDAVVVHQAYCSMQMLMRWFPLQHRQESSAFTPLVTHL